MNLPKCKEIVYHIKAQHELNRMLIATENILKIEADRLSILNQLEEGKKERRKTFEGIGRHRSLEKVIK
jgi:hypothetical protein